MFCANKFEKIISLSTFPIRNSLRACKFAIRLISMLKPNKYICR